MDIERNKADFEKAIVKAKEAIENMAGVVHVSIVTPISDMINEYEGYFHSDIEELMTENEQLRDRIDMLENEITEINEQRE